MDRTLYSLLWRLWDRRAAAVYRRELRALLRQERVSPEQMRRFQWERLQSLLGHAYQTVPFYRRRFDDAGVHPSAIRTPEDLSRIPILTRKDVQEGVEDMVSSESDRAAIQRSATSGSTGNPMPFYRGDEEHSIQSAARSRAQAWAGFRHGDKLAVLWGADQDIPSMDWLSRVRLRFGKRERWLNSYNMTPEKMEVFARLLIRWQPRHIQAYAASIYTFAKFLRERGWDRIRPHSIATSAEKLWDYQRALVEDVFQCRIFDFYGGREAPNIAAECEMHRGLHVLSDNVYLELLKDGRLAKPGEIGEIILTTLTTRAMPLIRYRNGDMARASDEVCPCRRPFPLLAEIVGRSNDMLVTPSGQFVHGAFFNHLFFDVLDVRQFQIHQRTLTEVSVSVVCRAPLPPDKLEFVMDKVTGQLGLGVQVTIHQVDTIPLTSSGKHRYIISDVGPTFAQAPAVPGG